MQTVAEAPGADSSADRRPGTRAPYIDGLRGLAILAVFLLHALAAVCPVSKNLLFSLDTILLAPLVYGKYGVAMFFVISGFCIHMSHRRATHKSWRRFAGQRFFRIYPPYLLCLLAMFFWIGPHRSLADPADARQFFMHLGLVHNLDAETLYGIHVPFWSIAVEAQLYAVYPLLCWLAASRGWLAAVVTAAAVEMGIQSADMASAAATGGSLPTWVTASPFAYWGSWALGALIAEHFLAGSPSPIARLRFDATLAAALVLGAVKPLEGFAFFAFALATGIAMERLFSGAWAVPAQGAWRRVGAHLAALGVVSYSFYLFHGPIVHGAGHLVPWALRGTPIPPVLRFLAACTCYPLAMLVSAVLHRFVEMPSIRAGQMLMRR